MNQCSRNLVRLVVNKATTVVFSTSQSRTPWGSNLTDCEGGGNARRKNGINPLCAINCSGSRTVRRVLTNSNYDGDASDFKWQNLETQRLIHKAVMVCKSLNCLAPGYLLQKLYYAYLISYNLRDLKKSLLFPCHEPNTIYRNNFCYSGAVLWNNLPSAGEAKPLTTFRKLSNV